MNFSIRTLALGLLVPAAALMSQTRVTYQPTNAIFPNPERGFYNHREVQAEGAGLSLTDLLNIRAQNRTLILRMYYLKKFRTIDLSAKQLTLISGDFAIMRTAGVKCILRFAYSSYESDPDAPLATVLRHLDQLRPILEANSDVIAVVQAGFIGAWGEWYYSTNALNNTNDRRTVLAKILDVLPKNWTVQIRTPNYKKDIFSITAPLTAAEAFSGSQVSRTAHHNDCFLASFDDYGTYQDTVADKLYLSLDTKFVAMGGETCVLSEFCPCSNALLELARMHWSFLNNDYNMTVLNTWVSGGCMDEVRRRLGYRFELTEGTYSDSVRPGGALTLELRIANRGWAAPFNPRSVEVLLRNLADSSMYVAALPEEPRFWFGGDSVTVRATVGVQAPMPTGRYALLLNLNDPSPSLQYRPEYSIRLANDSVWEPATGYNTLRHSVTIDAAASGPAYTDSLVFKPLIKTSSVGDGVRGSLPQGSTLLGNYPNPFNGQTVIAYTLPRRQHVTVRLHTILGQEVDTLVDVMEEAGRHDLYVDAGALASGVYIYTVHTETATMVGRMVLVR